ncbi:MAG: M16 family metallopeptidase [Vicinamibacterales bacterium]
MRVWIVCVALLAAAAPASAQADAWPAERPPAPLPARQSTFPPYQLRTLDNGLQVVAVLHHEQPVVSMRMIVRAGAAQDPAEKAGLSDLTAALLDQGTTTKSAREVNDEIDFLGGAVSAGSGADLSFVNVLVMRDSFEEGLRMLSDTVRTPGFAPEEIERQRQQAIASLRVNFESPEFVADAVFDRLVYGAHPYGVLQTGTPETLATITRSDLQEFHRQYFVPNNAILAVVGDVTAEDAFAGVENVFGGWERRDLPVQTFVAPPDPARHVIVVNRPDAVQTEVRAGQIGIKRNHGDYMPLRLALMILGGEGANRLHQVLRTERGLTYGAKADIHTMLEVGDFEASTNTRSEATGEALRLIVDEFWRLQRERVGERELAGAKAYLTGSFPLTIETPDAIATQVLNVLFYGLPVEQLQSFRERVNAVRADDIERVARYYLKPDRLAIVLVGNAAAFTPQLKGLGFTNFDVVDMHELDMTSADFRHARTRVAAGPAGVGAPPPLRPTPVAYMPSPAQAAGQSRVTAEEGARARALLERITAAKGGIERLRAVKSLVATTRARALGPDAPAETAETVTYIEYPNHVRVEARLGGAEIVQVYDGSRAWVRDPSGTHDVPAELVADFENGLERDTIALLVAAADGRVRVRRLPDVKDEKGAIHEALEFSGPDFEPLVMYADPATGLVAKQTYVAGGMGRPVVEESFSDYREVDGVQINYAASVRIGGNPALERTVTDVKIGGPLDPALFKRPGS